MANWKYITYRSVWNGLDFLFPPRCGGCGRIGSRWCDDCQRRVIVLEKDICKICGLPQVQTGVCNSCAAERPRFHAMRAWAIFDDPVRQALHKLKYRRDMSLGEALAVPLISFTQNLHWPLDLVIPIPLGRERLKQRGYNQVGMIALPIALGLNLKYAPKGLARRKETRSQVGLTRTERKENVKDAFIAWSGVKGKNVLVVDDVSTTGSTLSAGAEALLSSGAKEVYGLTVARALAHQMSHV